MHFHGGGEWWSDAGELFYFCRCKGENVRYNQPSKKSVMQRSKGRKRRRVRRNSLMIFLNPPLLTIPFLSSSPSPSPSPTPSIIPSPPLKPNSVNPPNSNKIPNKLCTSLPSFGRSLLVKSSVKSCNVESKNDRREEGGRGEGVDSRWASRYFRRVSWESEIRKAEVLDCS